MRLKFDIRTPGLFKLEFQGEGIVSLRSKSYICVSLIGNKLAHKGVKAAQTPLCLANYLKVLQGATQIAATNKGIWVWNKAVTTYEQIKFGLTSIYIK